MFRGCSGLRVRLTGNILAAARENWNWTTVRDTMATNSERSFNEALARVLRTKNPRWQTQLTAEQHRAVKGRGMPDLIVRNPRGAPVVVETEYLPARTVEQDAVSRLGRELADSGVAIEQCAALRAPKALQEAPQVELDERTGQATYEYCLFSRGRDGSDHVRWPSRGWITGGVDDLASLLESASISEPLRRAWTYWSTGSARRPSGCARRPPVVLT